MASASPTRSHNVLVALISAALMYLLSGVPMLVLLSIARLLGRDRVAAPSAAFEYWTGAAWTAGTLAYASVLIATAVIRGQSLGRVFARSSIATVAYLSAVAVVLLGPVMLEREALDHVSMIFIFGFADGTVFLGLTVPIAVHLVARKLIARPRRSTSGVRDPDPTERRP